MTHFNAAPTTEGIDDSPPTPSAGNAAADERPTPSKLARSLQVAGWVAFALGCLVAFTILKLPDDRIKAYVQGMIAAQLAPKGITFAAEKGYISIGWGISYVMKEVTFSFPPPQPAASLINSPSLPRLSR